MFIASALLRASVILLNENKMLSPAQWIKKNMLGTYSEELGRPLTEAELRVKRSLEQLSVPDWYIKYSKPTKILKNATPIECRRPTWKTMKLKNSYSPRKISRKSPMKTHKRTPKKTPNKSQSVVRGSLIESAINRAFAKLEIQGKNSNSVCTSTTSVSSDIDINTKLIDISNENPKKNVDINEMSKANNSPNRSQKKVQYNSLVTCNTFPRISPSRKIENINIVLSPHFPVDLPLKETPRTMYTMTKNIEMGKNDIICDEADEANTSTSHASFLIAEVNPSGVKTRVQVFAGLNHCNCEDEASHNQCKKSEARENSISNVSEKSNSPLPQEAVTELNRSITEGHSNFDHASLNLLAVSKESSEEKTNSPIDDVEYCELDISDTGDTNVKSISTNNFFNSSRKSTELERIVRTHRRESFSQRIDEIIDEFDRTVSVSCSNYSRGSQDFSLSLERESSSRRISDLIDDFNRSVSVNCSNYSRGSQNFKHSLGQVSRYVSNPKDDDCGSHSDGSIDSELNKSTSISWPNSESNSPSEEEDEEDVHWIPCKLVPLTCRCHQTPTQMPRTSSLLSMQSKDTNDRKSGRNSPNLSPIKLKKSKYSMQHQQQQQQQRSFKAKRDKVSKRLFRIDEVTGVIDSGYSDRSDCASVASFATFGVSDSEYYGMGRSQNKSGSQTYSSFKFCEFAAAYNWVFGEISCI